jgi:hypothetical protein
VKRHFFSRLNHFDAFAVPAFFVFIESIINILHPSPSGTPDKGIFAHSQTRQSNRAFLTFEVGHNMITLTHDMILGHFREVEAFDESLRICTGLRHGDEVIERP